MGDTPNPATFIEQGQVPEPKPDALAQVASNLSGLKAKEDSLLVISGKSLGDVLPAKFYEGASQLQLTEEEKAVLLTVQDATDDEIEIRPDGLIYVEHITVRRALSKVFGAEWALVPGSPIAQEKMEKGILVCQRWVLVVRSCYVGEAIGAGSFYDNNIKQNKTDAAESACSEAIRRICAKTALGICSNVFQKSTARRWRKEYAVEVWVKGKYETAKQWRRKDADPFEGEIGPVETKASKEEKQAAKPLKNEAPTPTPPPAPEPSTEEAPAPEWTDAELSDAPPSTPEPPKTTGTAAEPEPQHVYTVGTTPGMCAECGKPIGSSMHVSNAIRESKPNSKPAVPSAPPPAQAAPSEPMVTDGNWRLFMMDARRRGLVNGDVAEGAIAFLSNKPFNVKLANGTGRKQLEVLNAMFKTLTSATFNEVIKKVREFPMKG